MRLMHAARHSGKIVRLLSVALSCAFLAVLPARAADTIVVFNVDATVGNTQTSNEVGTYTGDAVTGTVTIDTTTGVGTAIDITVAGFELDNLFSCTPDCVFGATIPFNESGELAFGGSTLVGYSGGSLTSASEVTLPVTIAGRTSNVAFDISGDVSSASSSSTGPITPEPSSIILSLSGMGGLGLAWVRRRILPTR